ncbi:MAG: hypothetical protein GY716_09710 [bacterium]|nr:hypothetical protein [bacterium]
MSYINRFGRTHKSTIGRTFAAIAGLLVASLAIAPTTTLAGSPDAEDPYAHTLRAMAVSAELNHLVDTPASPSRAGFKHVRDLREALLAHDPAPADNLSFVFRLVGLARESGIVSFFTVVETPGIDSAPGDRLAAGVFHNDRIVVFDASGVRRLPPRQTKPIGDRAATAVLLADAGKTLLDEGDAKGAIDSLENAVMLDPKLRDAWHDLGVALRREGERERALDAYERSLDLVAVGSER